MGTCCHGQTQYEDVETQAMEIVTLGKEKKWDEIMERIDKPPFKDNMENIMKINLYGVTLLHRAAEQGNLEIIKKLLSIGFDINVLDKSKHCAVGFSCAGGYMDCVKYFVENGADINLIDIHGHGPLYAAATRDHLHITKYLIENGADMNVPCNDQGRTPGEWARYYGRTKCADYLEQLAKES